jgi:hypothetical protein
LDLISLEKKVLYNEVERNFYNNLYGKHLLNKLFFKRKNLCKNIDKSSLTTHLINNLETKFYNYFIKTIETEYTSKTNFIAVIDLIEGCFIVNVDFSFHAKSC